MSFLRMLLVVLTLAWVSAAQASLIFRFSFNSNAAGEIPGPITGEIHLVDVSGPQKATKVVITGIGSHAPVFGHALPFVVTENDTPKDGWIVGNNSFTVQGTSIDLWNFDAFHNHLASIVSEQLQLGSTGALTPFFMVGVLDAQNALVFRSTLSIDFPEFVLLQQGSAPAPSVLVLLAIGCTALVLVSRRRRPATASL